MNKLLLPLLFSFLLASCDTPVRTEYSKARIVELGDLDTNEDGAESEAEATGFENGLENTNFNAGGGTTTPTPGTSPSTNEYSHCSDQYQYSAFELGRFNLCKNSQNPKMFRTSFEAGSRCFNGVCGYCLIPMHSPGQGAIPIGNPECFHFEPGQSYFGHFTTTNNSVSLNSVIVIAYAFLGEFDLALKRAYAEYNRCIYTNGERYHQNCIASANQEIAKFTQMYANYYQLVNF